MAKKSDSVVSRLKCNKQTFYCINQTLFRVIDKMTVTSIRDDLFVADFSIY